MDGTGNGQPLTKAEFLEGIGQLRAGMEARLVAIEERLRGFADTVQGLDGKVQGLDERVQGLDERVQGLDERVRGLDERVQALKEYVDERTHDAETRLLRGFADFASSYEIRMRKLSADMGNLNTVTDTRLSMVEERLASVERKLLARGM